jgi:adenylate cyclase
MPDPSLPRRFQLTKGVHSVDEMWYLILTEGDPMKKRARHVLGLLPHNPRCVSCHSPFAGLGGTVARLMGLGRRSTKNPRYCTACELFTSKYPGGAEIELTMLFVDVRGSTALAEKMPDVEFSRLMNRFYEAAINVLIHADAFIDKLVGDEVTALFFPGYAGKEHAHKAVEAGQEILRVTGHAAPDGPWVPVGVGIHTGTAWVGSIVGAGGISADFTALGDNVNVAARLASKAGAGEVLLSESTYLAAHLENNTLEKRELELKGKSEAVRARVLHAGDPIAASPA